MTTRHQQLFFVAILCTIGLAQSLQAEDSQPFEVIRDYKSYIAGEGEVTVWYGDRTALVLDDEPNPEDRDPKTMAAILNTLDDIFDAYDQVTGRKPKLTAPLKGRIRIEVSRRVGGGLAHHGRLGIGIGDGFFKGLYERFARGERTVDQVLFYEIARNYWMADMNPAIDYHTSKGPADYGWWTVGFNNAMSIFLPQEIDSIDDMYYFGSGGKKFADGMESNLTAYLDAPQEYNWENSWNVPLVPWKERTSVNDLMTGLLVRLHRDHGGIDFIKRLYAEIPKRESLKSRADRQGARDNFYQACSIAAGKDLFDFFSGELRWKITPDRHRQVQKQLQLVAKKVPLNVRAKRWDVVELRRQIGDAPKQPFDLQYSIRFEHSSGKNLVVPGFYDGNNQYVVRFTPPLSGTWTYRSTSDSSELDGQTGTVVAEDTDLTGGVIIDPKRPTRFRYENGSAYYPIAFESDWLFALDAENAEGIPATQKFVDTLASNGFNQVVMNVYAYDVKWAKDSQLDAKFDYGSPRVFPFGGTNESPNFSTLDVEYFQRLDRVIDYLNQKGIVAHLMIYVWNKRVNWPEANSEGDNRYFDYVVRRYQAYPNLVWDISKEALGYGHTDVNYISDRITRLRELDAYKRLITVHDYSYCRRFTNLVDFVSVQLWSSELFGVMRKVCQDMPGKPILNIEHGGYERSPYVVFNGNYTSPEVCLERAYQCVFAGTYPTHYWQGAAWNVIFPDIESMPKASQPKLQYYRHMRSFVEKFQVDNLIAGDKKSNAGFSLHDGDNQFIYYVPKECDFIGLRLPKSFRGGEMVVTWFNPFTGEYDAPQRKPIPQWPAVQAPDGDGFRILIVQAEPPTSK